MKSIGGYFELELPLAQHRLYEGDAVFLNSGRNALEYILLSLEYIKKVYIPYYTCDVVLEPFIKHQIHYAFYTVNERLEIRDTIQLKENEYIIVNNYFGIKDAYVRKMAKQYGKQIIIDNAQAMYAPHIDGTLVFYSPRKYVGIPDGGVAYTLNHPGIEIPQDYSNDRVSHLMKRIDIDSQSGYADFKANSKKLSMQPVRQMSMLTKRLFTSIDFEEIKERRLRNFAIIREALDATNELLIPQSYDFECPMVYPYMTLKKGLRDHLIKNNIFVATYWPNVKEWATDDNSQARLAEQIIPIPCDQRYNEADMNFIIDSINAL